MKIAELQTQEEWQEAFPVMRELRTTLDEQAYLCLIVSMVKEGYRLFAHCRVVAPSLRLERTDAHRFYQKQMDYDKTSYVFKKTVL